jgi:hypothetical protein
MALGVALDRYQAVPRRHKVNLVFRTNVPATPLCKTDREVVRRGGNGVTSFRSVGVFGRVVLP